MQLKIFHPQLARKLQSTRHQFSMEVVVSYRFSSFPHQGRRSAVLLLLAGMVSLFLTSPVFALSIAGNPAASPAERIVS